MKKAIAFLIIASALLTLVSCGSRKITYLLLHEDEEIKQISIVIMSQERTHSEYAVIHNISRFLKDFRKVECSMIIVPSSPIYLSPDDPGWYVIKIEYYCGDYELIHWTAQDEYYADEDRYRQSGYISFDEDGYRMLVERYIKRAGVEYDEQYE